MEVYLDVVLLENFIVDYFLLYLTSQMLRCKMNWKNYSLGALVGSLYTVVIFFPSLKLLVTLPFKILFTVLIVAITFKKRKPLFLIKASIIFFAASFVLAGLCVFISLNDGNEFNILYTNITLTYREAMLAFMIIYITFHRIFTSVKDSVDLSKLIYDVNIIIDNSRVSIKAFLDTGSELREPATNLPVMVIDKKILKDIKLEVYDKFYISYKVVNGEGGILEGFKPDYIELQCKDRIEKREVIIAYNESTLKGIEEYNALLSRGII